MTDTDTLIDRRLLERIRSKKQILDERRPLPADAVKRLNDEMRLFHTYHSDAIEGNTLTLQETKIVIEEGMTIGGKSLREHLEAAGNAEAFDLIGKLASDCRPLDHVIIQEIHEIVTKGQLKDSGKYRTQNVRIAGAVKTPPTFSKIPQIMDNYLVTIRAMRQHPLEVAGYVHHRFVEVHPFIDGNGRVARLITNLYLISEGYPPVILKKEDRKKYYAFLQKADLGDRGPLINFIAQAMAESLSRYLSIFGGKYELLPLSELAGTSPYSQDYLSLRARQGVLEAVKMENLWYSTKDAIVRYTDAHGRSNNNRMEERLS